ncbi:MAG: hypothetical protein F6K17_39415, partial [Okeania sp. SIO3C4]|nr:hypothetical protein [Okeania sp. SIO3C4]
ILEPMARNTAPAIAALAVFALAHAPDALLAVLPADHLIADAEAFADALAAGRAAAADGKIVTFGVYQIVINGLCPIFTQLDVEGFIAGPISVSIYCYFDVHFIVSGSIDKVLNIPDYIPCFIQFIGC